MPAQSWRGDLGQHDERHSHWDAPGFGVARGIDTNRYRNAIIRCHIFLVAIRRHRVTFLLAIRAYADIRPGVSWHLAQQEVHKDVRALQRAATSARSSGVAPRMRSANTTSDCVVRFGCSSDAACVGLFCRCAHITNRKPIANSTTIVVSPCSASEVIMQQ